MTEMIVLSPLGAPDPSAFRYAPRPASLAGARLALVENTKYNAEAMLEELAGLLKGRVGLAEVRTWHKIGPARGVAPEQMAEMRQAGVDAAIAGIGD